MGWDSDQPIKQDDIDTAIKYLFPSSLTDKLALPVMKPPDEIMPRFHKFEFDDEGRPKDLLFYTLRPKFYSLMSVSEYFFLVLVMFKRSSYQTITYHFRNVA